MFNILGSINCSCLLISSIVGSLSLSFRSSSGSLKYALKSRDALVRFRLSSGIIPAVLYAVNIFIADSPKNVGNRCGIELILMHCVRSVPRPMPKRDVVVN